MIRSCLLQYSYSFKSENNCCSVYMKKTFNVHTPNENSLLDLDRSDTHIHNIDAKRCKVDNDSATYLWHCRLGHIDLKSMKKLHADGFLESLDYYHLILVNLASWARSLKLRSPKRWSELITYWK